MMFFSGYSFGMKTEQHCKKASSRSVTGGTFNSHMSVKTSLSYSDNIKTLH